MADLKPITRQEKIISGEDIQPITRLEYFLKEYSGGNSGGGSGGGGSSIKLDTTLTKEGYAADAKAVGDAIAKFYTDVDIYIVTGGQRITFEDAMAMGGSNVVWHKQIVETLPENLKSSAVAYGDGYLYIVRNTGFVYINIGGNVMTVGFMLTQAEDVDHGWTVDIKAATEDGVYCVGTTSNTNNASGGLSIKKIEFTDRPSAWAWLAENATKVIRTTLTANILNKVAVYSICVPDVDSGGIVSVVTFSNTLPTEIGEGYVKLWVDFLRITNSNTTANIQGHYIQMGDGLDVHGAALDTVHDENWSAMELVITCYYID